jgi:hypothetical protein
LALADPRPMSLKEKQRMTQFTLRPPDNQLTVFTDSLLQDVKTFTAVCNNLYPLL